MKSVNAATAVVLFALTILCSSGCNSGDDATGETKRLIILTNGSSPYWDACVTGAKDAADKLKLGEKGYTIEIARGDYTPQVQIEKLKQYSSSTDVAAVAISVTDPNNAALLREMKKVQEAGIKLITIDSDVSEANRKDARFAYLGTDNVAAGRELGKAIKAIRSEGGEYATFVGIKGAANALERNQGLKEGLGSEYDLAANMENGQDTTEKPRQNVADALDQHEGLDVLIGIWSYNAPAIVKEVNARGVKDEVTVAAFDAEPQTITGMEKKSVDVMVVQNPYEMGRQGTRLLYALVTDDKKTVDEFFPKHGEAGGDLFDTGLRIVAPDAESGLKQDLFDDATEFMTLEEFKTWLADHKLTGS